MTKYYDITLIDKIRNRKVSYIATAFSVNSERILQIKNENCVVVVQIEKTEELYVNELH